MGFEARLKMMDDCAEEIGCGDEGPQKGGLRQEAQARSPRMRRASWMSLGMMVTRLAWMAQRLVSSKSPTSAITAELWKRRSVLKSCAISRTSRWKGSLRISSSVDFW
ncbi:hypothetical protein QYF61_001595 [Mycteria americana]|uniref:Uncharacterized protein n=1 Tax=Mycteria americana TaxID=33587 RepID=A0AAN7NP15_MYCAM|nr:hypothetical protein QYF61_001595 [Mycteria americana]